ncbi:MAG: TlpA family protein disulfide reductase [Dechloromonas sp.]|nr:TlpA family protein disulfide reductase [Dechloromonas sp.]
MIRLLLAGFVLVAAIDSRAEISLGQRIDWPAVVDINGKAHAPSAFSGRAVVVVFWASWCPLCRTELPEIKRFHETSRDKELNVLAVSIDENPRDVRNYQRLARLPFPITMQTQALTSALGAVDAIPTTLVFDRRGVLRFRHVGAIDAEQLHRVTAPLIGGNLRQVFNSTAR